MAETSTSPALTPAQEHAGQRIDALDLEPVTYKLMHPEPGQTAMSLAAADQLITAYRCYLKLCAWYPGEPVVPSKAIDEAWHAHILDTAKYAADTETVFGYFLHHFPYFGLRGPDDEAALSTAYTRTRDLFRQHFGADLPGQQPAGTCNNDGQDGTGCIDMATAAGECLCVVEPKYGRSAGAQLSGVCSECSTGGEGRCISCTRTAPGLTRPRPARVTASA